MKKLLVLLLVTAMTFACVACGNAESGDNKETAGNEAVKVEIADANEILTKAWDEYKASAGEDIQFPIGGGYAESMVMDAPAKFDMAAEGAKDMLVYSFCIPAEELEKTDDAATMMNMMMANNFSSAAYHVADAANVEAVIAGIKDATMNNQWMCGFPDSLLIRSMGDSYVVMAFGVNDAMTPFETHLTAAYPGMETIASEAIG